MGALPTFRGYTVDYRLREFRRMVYGERPLFIPFDSPKGERLLAAMRREEDDEAGNDLFTQLKRELEEVEVRVTTLRSSISRLIERYERSDHPAKREHIARLR